MVDNLIDIIGREAALFESFLELLKRQQRALVEHDLEELNRVTALQREKLQLSRQLNAERERVLVEIKRTNAIEGDLTVSRLLDMVDRNRAGQLSELRDSILALNDQITKTRNQNAMLLNRSREYIRKTMEMLSHIASPRTTYSASGGQAGQGTVAVDRRA